MHSISSVFRNASPFWTGFAAALFAVAVFGAGIILIVTTATAILAGSVPSDTGATKGDSSFTYAGVNLAFAAALIVTPVLWRPIRTSVFGRVTGDQPDHDQRVIGARIGVLATCLTAAALGVSAAFLR